MLMSIPQKRKNMTCPFKDGQELFPQFKVLFSRPDPLRKRLVLRVARLAGKPLARWQSQQERCWVSEYAHTGTQHIISSVFAVDEICQSLCSAQTPQKQGGGEQKHRQCVFKQACAPVKGPKQHKRRQIGQQQPDNQREGLSSISTKSTQTPQPQSPHAPASEAGREKQKAVAFRPVIGIQTSYAFFRPAPSSGARSASAPSRAAFRLCSHSLSLCARRFQSR